MTRRILRFAAAPIVIMAWAAAAIVIVAWAGGTAPYTALSLRERAAESRVPHAALSLRERAAEGRVRAFSQTQAAALRVFDSGVHIDTFRRPGDLAVQYAISIPKNYSLSNPVPLVLALHYGGNPNGAAQGLLLQLVQPAFAELGAIIVAPESVRGAWSTAESERAVNSLLEAVEASYRIDTKKIAVTGFSMGGTGVWFFAGKYPERFSAAVPVAGMPSAAAAEWRTPVFAVHSRNDEVMAIGPTETRIKELQMRGVRAELVVLTGISHYETNRFVEGLRRAVPWLRETWK